MDAGWIFTAMMIALPISVIAGLNPLKQDAFKKLSKIVGAIAGCVSLLAAIAVFTNARAFAGKLAIGDEVMIVVGGLWIMIVILLSVKISVWFIDQRSMGA